MIISEKNYLEKIKKLNYFEIDVLKGSIFFNNELITLEDYYVVLQNWDKEYFNKRYNKALVKIKKLFPDKNFDL